MKVKAKLKELLTKAKEPATISEACDCKECECKPLEYKTFKVICAIKEEYWHSDLQRYVIVNPEYSSEVIISEGKLIEFITTDTYDVRRLLDSNKFDDVKVETVKE